MRNQEAKGGKRMSEAKKRRTDVNQPTAKESAGNITKATGGRTGGTTDENSDTCLRNRTWISWFCSLKRNGFFCEVDEAYIQDRHNLFGLSEVVPHYKQALDLILDFQDLHADTFFEEQDESVKSAAEMLYGLIHVRYILTSAGMDAMRRKFMIDYFGTCPRVYCNGQRCLPVGQSDIPGSAEVRIYCPKCEEMYMPMDQSNPDGAYFGTTFPHMFLMTYEELKPVKASEKYVPRVFGFKIHKLKGHN